MTTLWLDSETYHTEDIKLIGGYNYVRTCDPLLIQYAFDDDDVTVVDLTAWEPLPHAVCDAITSPDVIKVAHNVGFDRGVMANLGMESDIRSWRDTAVLCLTNGLPMDLDRAGQVLGLGDQAKIKDGKRLVNLFCSPAPRNHKVDRYDRHNKPEDWERFKEYGRMDVVAMREIARRLDHTTYLRELDNWFLNLRMNERGLPMDVDLAQRFIDQLGAAEATRLQDLRDLTGGEIATVNQTQRILSWCAEHGATLPNLTKGTVAEWAERPDVPEHVREVLRIRQQLGKSSTAKYAKIISATDEHGRIHGAFQFYGANRTGREAGRIYQPQNLPRPEYKQDVLDEIIDRVMAGEDLLPSTAFSAASSCLRSMTRAPTGRVFAVADLSNIEGRMLAWLAGEEWKLQAFRDYDAGVGPDVYIKSYAQTFSVDAGTLNKDSPERQVGKTMELACGYQGAVGAFRQMAGGDVAELSDERIVEIVKAWRAAHPNVVALWYTADNAAAAAMGNPGIWYKIGERLRICYQPERRQLLLRLPSGRDLAYWEPHYDNGTLRYWGLDTQTKQWVEMDTYGGKLIENATQGAARDVMFHGAHLAETAGYDLIGTVHDELITEVDSLGAECETLCQCMSTVPDWADGLPLAAEGYIAKRYRK